jgi:hypothetical protein
VKPGYGEQMAGTCNGEELAVGCAKESAMEKEFFKKSKCSVVQQWPGTEFEEISCTPRQPAPPGCNGPVWENL